MSKGKLKKLNELGVNMTLTSHDGDIYLTTPIYQGAIEIEQYSGSLYVWYREWSYSGLSKETELDPVPDVPIEEQAAYIRMMLVRQERKLAAWTEEQKVYDACKLAQIQGKEISHAVAREIAYWYHDYREGINDFISTGAITTPDLWHNLFSNLNGDSMYANMDENNKLAADMFGTYLVQRRVNNETGPVECWTSMRMGKD